MKMKKAQTGVAAKAVKAMKSSSKKKKLIDSPIKKPKMAGPYMAKKGGSFKDLSGDGKITQKDVLIGRGVLPKKSKSGSKIKKAQLGLNQTAEPSSEPTLRTRQYKRLGRLSAKNPSRAKKVASRMVERATREERGKKYMTKNVSKFTPAVPTVQKKGGVTKKKMMGGGKMMMKSGGKMTKKCKYGCK